MKLVTVFLLTIGLTSPAFAKRARSMTCPKKWPGKIYVPFNDVMTIEFPEKPKTSLPGNQNFDFQFIGEDLAIKGLSPKSRANLFVYLRSDKCMFKLITVLGNSDDVVRIKYPKEKTIEVKYVK